MVTATVNRDFPKLRTNVTQPEPGIDPGRKSTEVRVRAKDFSLWYGDRQALRNIALEIPSQRITAIIGPSGCGKSTFLRAINRMNDLIAGVRTGGELLLDGTNINGRDVDVVALRRNVGMVFQQPNPFPKSIFDNVAYGLRVNGLVRRSGELGERVEEALRQAAIWDEIKDRLHTNALALSGGEQQRLCIARALAVRPEVLLMDEPASALDPVSTAKIEELIFVLKSQYTIVIVTHNMQQAARVSDQTAFFLQGELIECGGTAQLFTNPSDKRTEDYITGRFG
jgi:phosphate transport system ATP-binding protein